MNTSHATETAEELLRLLFGYRQNAVGRSRDVRTIAGLLDEVARASAEAALRLAARGRGKARQRGAPGRPGGPQGRRRAARAATPIAGRPGGRATGRSRGIQGHASKAPRSRGARPGRPGRGRGARS